MDRESVLSSLATVHNVNFAECLNVVKWEWKMNISIEWDETEKGTMDMNFIICSPKNKGQIKAKEGLNRGFIK